MPLTINYKRNREIKEKYPERSDLEIWLMTHSWKIRKLNAKLDGKPLAELIRLDERLIVVIDGKNKKMNILNDVEIEDF
ncbi:MULTISPECIES: hypothetical protein [Methanobacterium]|uniref:Uncharacterized protein n=1 Tax=Methanobacterium bryantii TaxID=2161 RepID=A0A2A2H3W4_METBR|nr:MULTISPECIES: hypothetical protein [Methanobacterium]OEC84616.1 hypothetical protein A9507_15155 [Methanobacterium sp. A39]PAV04088.1 hypothetical protein ASJ80_03480 [Methanobacterium bryantii]